MNLHNNRESFSDLITVTADYIGIPETAVKRDYYIVKLLQNLQNSNYADKCVFKGGTSLSKCYTGSIERFSEAIDLTYIPNNELSSKQYDMVLKKMESAIIADAQFEKIVTERNNRNKSSYVWFENEDRDNGRIKLEIGSSVRPEPYEKRGLKTYIQEYLDSRNMQDIAKEFGLTEVKVLVLRMERTFVDKLFSVKRHSICGTLPGKVRHIYDVVRLYSMPEIQSFLDDKVQLKNIVSKTKETDSFYLEKRNIPEEYNPKGRYDFQAWRIHLNDAIRKRYESMHVDLLYTDKRQDFDRAIDTFEWVDNLLAEIDE